MRASLSQEDLAERSGLTTKGISALERGQSRRPYPRTLRLLADALGLDDEDRALLTAAGFVSSPASSSSEPTIQEAAAEQSGPSMLAPVPAPLTALLGREQEMSHIQRLLLDEGVRLLTLLGPGGVGKTRLALEVARSLAGRFGAGLVFVPLGSIGDASQVENAIGRTLGVDDAGRNPLRARIVEELRQGARLLVLDNFEHLLPAAPLVPLLLIDCPALVILVTSRTPLLMSGERELTISPLTLPDRASANTFADAANATAVQLFTERARAVRADFELTPANCDAVVAICRRLAGLPLAIELAAAHIRLLPPAALLARLEPALPMLTRGARNLPERQRTMRLTLDWSYNLLDPPAQQLFRRLGVFSGSWTIGAAESICGRGDSQDVLGGLETLVSSSLAQSEPDESAEPRFALLEPVREYALERLSDDGDLDSSRDDHANYFANLAETIMREQDERASMDAIEQDYGNFSAALARTLGAGRAELADRLCRSLWSYWYLRGVWTEGRQWLERALRLERRQATRELATVLYGAGLLAWGQGDFADAREHVQKSLTVSRAVRDPGAETVAVQMLGVLAYSQGYYAESRAHHEAALALARARGSTRLTGRALHYLGDVALSDNEVALAHERFQESLEYLRAAGDNWFVMQSLRGIGDAAFIGDDLTAAERAWKASLDLQVSLGADQAPARSASLVDRLGLLSLRSGDLGLGRQRFTQSLREFSEQGDPRGVGESLTGLAAVLLAQNRLEQAVRLLAAAHSASEQIGASLWPVFRVEYERAIGTARASLGEARFEAHWAEGASRPTPDAVREALGPT
jgi:predicted ATPase